MWTKSFCILHNRLAIYQFRRTQCYVGLQAILDMVKVMLLEFIINTW